jgi:hypothetical protein
VLRKKFLAIATAFVLFVLGTGTAQAWDLIADKRGHGRVTLRGSTRNHNQVAFVATHAGTRVEVTIKVTCRDGYRFERTWRDGGEEFNFIRTGLGGNGRCNHTFTVQANRSPPLLWLVIWARG